MRQRNPHAGPIHAPVTRVEIVGWQGLCLACGKMWQGKTPYRYTCSGNCRARYRRMLLRQRQREQELAEEDRIRRAELRLTELRRRRYRIHA